MFESTTPFGQPELLRASGYQRYLDEMEAEARERGINARIASLTPSVRADLYRFEAEGRPSDLLEVMAACMRHVQRLTIHLRFGSKVAPLTVFAEERLLHCAVKPARLLENGIAELEVMHVEPAVLRPPGDHEKALVGDAACYHPLAPLLWALAFGGARNELLPEIAGPAVYRIAPGLETDHLPLGRSLGAAVQRLREGTHSLREVAEWPGVGKDNAVRLINGLYLQAGLMVSRSHPEALHHRWFGKSA